MELVIAQVTVEAKNVLSLRLKAADGATLPSWEPGAHIELVCPRAGAGITRCVVTSTTNAPTASRCCWLRLVVVANSSFMRSRGLDGRSQCTVRVTIFR